ncbi:PREDICTED: uncharacterized protein LOC104716258 [Camelina sativa]|uniref:Uncharacterized protein LOC104716258 n=1 Tax=Camelina sativa TaxID=90675 RepID=A0ABM0TV62_CAMSA|nr:PREDICTED: uncharacterized protein LOC104716258 [Camelina sativa]
MERNTPVRNPHTSTADLLSWSETPPPQHSTTPSAARSHQPSDGISKILGGGQITDEEAQSLNKLKNCSGYKLKEMTGSGIFTDKAKVGSDSDATDPKTGLRYYQQTLNGMSQISFSADGNVSPKKPTTLTEVAKQRELSGNLLTEADLKSNKQISSAKIEEISGHNIFGPPPEIQPRSLAAAQQEARGNRDMGEPAPRNLRTSVKVSNPAGGQSNILFSEEPVVQFIFGSPPTNALLFVLGFGVSLRRRETSVMEGDSSSFTITPPSPSVRRDGWFVVVVSTSQFLSLSPPQILKKVYEANTTAEVGMWDATPQRRRR